VWQLLGCCHGPHRGHCAHFWLLNREVPAYTMQLMRWLRWGAQASPRLQADDYDYFALLTHA
jgi:hypothetical protein